MSCNNKAASRAYMFFLVASGYKVLQPSEFPLILSRTWQKKFSNDPEILSSIADWNGQVNITSSGPFGTIIFETSIYIDFVKTRLCRPGFLPSTTILTSPFATGSIWAGIFLLSHYVNNFQDVLHYGIAPVETCR